MPVEGCFSRGGAARLGRLVTVFHIAHASLLLYYLVARTWYPRSYAFAPTDYLTEIGLTREIELWLMALLWLWRKWSTCGTLEEFADTVLLTSKVVAGSVLFICGGTTEVLRFGLLWGLVLALVRRPDYQELGCVESLSPSSLAMRVGPCDKNLDCLRPAGAPLAAASKSAAAAAARARGLGCQVRPAPDAGADGTDAPSPGAAAWAAEGEAGDGKLEGLVPWVVMVGASWSERCAQLTPMLAELSDQYQGAVRFGRVDAARWPDAAEALRVNAKSSSSPQVPTFLLFRGGREAARLPALDPATGEVREDAGVLAYNAAALAAALALGPLATKAAGRRAAALGSEVASFRRTDGSASAPGVAPPQPQSPPAASGAAPPDAAPPAARRRRRAE
ncbi:hypothetical protein FNF29_04539 [Cafeteria roenbergensis]|uniref:Thioredoxin domain-containing protein n=1 Tax=Cafeteria roenbergensis TaxID=33653 RepID=A0A5A8D700_CAFRO|nr:hypothetical protein FNF29_04539 [Cafeteria roenbergensis]KAA0161015.1 hypothetical protein FNF28_05221 [Cafeteria roenbergensis]|eukprot:KAA0151615.1 hypothetical protein FNF29_04539 [Cafeteria roenbergensis]